MVFFHYHIQRKVFAMKKTIKMILATICVFTLAGCGLFSSESKESSTGDVKLSDTYTYKDPEGLEFATRYAYTSGESQEIAEGYKASYDVDCLSEYVFIYADKDDKAVAQYDYWVLKTEEDAKKLVEQIGMFGNGTLQQEGNVVWDNYDADGVSDLILMQKQYSGLSEDTGSGYAQFIKEAYGYMDAK